MWKEHWAKKEDNPVVKIETQHQRKDGTIFPVEIISNYYVYEGKEYCFAFGRDITERKKTEEKLRLARFTIDKSSDAAFWLDKDAKFSYVNEAACRFMGYTKEELLTMGVQDIDPDFPADVWSQHWQELKEKRTLVFESRHKARDGRIIPVEITANFVAFEGKEYNCAFARDISKRKEAERALRFTQFAVEHVGVSAFLSRILVRMSFRIGKLSTSRL